MLGDEDLAEHVTYEGWLAIDRAESAAGEGQGRPRIKLCTREQLLIAAGRSGREVKAAQAVGEQLAG